MTRKLIAIAFAVGAMLGAWGDSPTPMTPVQSCTVTFNLNAYSSLNYQVTEGTRTVPKGTCVGELPEYLAPHHAGWGFGQFQGWYTVKSGGTKVTESTIVNGNVTYYGRWIYFRYVEFYANDGEVSDYGFVESGKSLGTLPLPTPTRDGYTFDGWYTAASGGTKVTSSTTVTATDANIITPLTYYAHWTAQTPIQTYTVTFDVNGYGALRDSEKTMQLTSSDRFGYTCLAPTPAVPNKAGVGYGEFQGWYTTGAASGGTKLVDGTSVTRNITYYARWTYFRYVVFDPNGGSVSDSYRHVQNGSSIGNLPTPTRDGYTFDGWYTAASGGTKVTSSTTVTATSANITTPLTYYAHWTENCQPPDCDPPPYNLDWGWGGAFKFYEEADDADGLNLAAWGEWSMGDWVPFWFGVGIKMAIPIEGLQYTLTEDDVVLVAGSYSGFGNPQIVSDEWMYQKHYTALKNAIGRAPDETDDGLYGPVFEGDVRGRKYSLSLEIWPNGQTVAGRQWILIEIGGRATQGIKTFYLGLKQQDIYLYYGMHACEEQIGKPSSNWAHGELAALPWPIGAGTVTGGGVYRNGDNVTLTAIPAEDGEFMGWYDGDGERWLGTSPTLGHTSSGSGKTTIYAVFKQSTVRTITFNANGGSVSPSSKQVDLGETLGELPVPGWTGRTFTGWWTSASGGTRISESTTVTGNATYYAHWAVNLYTATFNANGGSGGTTKTQEAGSSLTAPTVTRTGYSFTGWSPPVPSTMPASNTTYKAQWRIKSYLVSFNAQGGSCGTKRVYKNHNAKIGALPAATRESFEFLGWYTAADGGEMIDSKTVITSDVTFYAHWRQTAPILTIVNGWLTKVEMGPFSEVAIPDGVTRIGDRAFSQCTNLVSVAIPDSVTSIGGSAFNGCSGLTSVKIPDSVTSIGYEAFKGCSGLTRVKIPDSVTGIGYAAFEGCSGLTSVTIPDNVTYIGGRVFEGCDGLLSVTVPQSVCDSTAGEVFSSACRAITNVVISCGVTHIGDRAFQGCSGLVSVVIPDGVTHIGDCAFEGCSELMDVTIPESVTSIGWYAFKDCIGLTSITIPDSVTNIKGHVFEGCGGLVSVTVPQAVCDSTADEIFSSACQSITNVVISCGVTNIGDRAFRKCSGLMSVVIPDGVTDIGQSAFEDCSGLTSVTIGNGVTSIGYQAFSGCSGLTGVYITDIAKWCSISFGGDNPLWYAHDLYLNGEKVTALKIPSSVMEISSYQFSGCSGLTSVKIPDGVTSIGYEAFKGCSGLTSVTIGNGVTNIERSAFYNCSGLPNVTIPDGVSSIGAYTFCNCSGLTNITIPDSVTRIGRNAFSGCNSLLDTTTIPGVGLVDGWVVGYDASLPEHLVLSGIRGIGDKAFANCIDADSHWGRPCENLTSVVITDDIVNIGFLAFECDHLTSVTILSKSVTVGDGWAAEGGKFKKVDVYASSELKEVLEKLDKDKDTRTTYTTVTFTFAWPPLCISYGTIVQVYVEEGQENRGAVSGYGAYQSGKTATLKATPKKGYVFAGWYEGRFENGKLRVNEGAVLSRSASYEYPVPTDHVVIVARFASTDEDTASLKMEVADDVAAADGTVALDLSACVESLSQPKLAVSGLPSGVKFDAKTMTISGKATKPGVYTVKVTATNASATGKNAVVKEFKITVPNLTTPMFEAAGLDTEGKYVLTAGVVPAVAGRPPCRGINEVVATVVEGGWKLAVSGLPTGLKYGAKSNKITGVATKEGFYTVYFTVTRGIGKGVEKQIATATFEVVFPTLTLEMAAWNGANATNNCKVAGGGKYPFGKKVTLKAMPAKGSVFVGWYEGNGEWGTGNGEPISKTASYSYVTKDEDVALTAVFATVAEDTDSIALKVDGKEMSGSSDGSPTTAYTNYCGVAVDWPIAAEALSAATVKATGLPSGVKLVQDKKTGAYSLVGTPSAASKADKNTGMLNPNLVKLTVTTAGKSSKTYAFDWTILPLPAWAQGTFEGVVWRRGDASLYQDGGQGLAALPSGTVTLTVDAKGKISGKLIDADGTWTLSAAAYERVEGLDDLVFHATVIGKNGKLAIANEVTVASKELAAAVAGQPPYRRGVVSGWTAVGPSVAAAGDSRPPEWAAWQNLWKTEPWKTEAKAYAKAPKLMTVDGIELKFGASGAVTAKYDKYLCSTVLIPTEDGMFYVFCYFPPKAGKFDGCAIELLLEWDGTAFQNVVTNGKGD